MGGRERESELVFAESLPNGCNNWGCQARNLDLHLSGSNLPGLSSISFSGTSAWSWIGSGTTGLLGLERAL